MPRTDPNIPSESDVLCEQCGYRLNGLPQDANCPECGQPVASSTTESPRHDTPAERGIRGYFSTTMEVLFHPTHFYRTLTTRGSVKAARWYGWFFYILTVVIIQFTLVVHLGLSMATGQWLGVDKIFDQFSSRPMSMSMIMAFAIFYAFMPIVLFLLMEGTTRLAAKLTAWEAAYRGYRMPYPIVLRALYFHAPHYLPVALMISLTVFGFRLALDQHWLDVGSAPIYLYILCGQVVVGAIYLFQTYWMGMRNIMYANR